MAIALVVASKAGGVCCADVVVSIFAVSIPSTIAYAGFARIIQEDEKRNPGLVMAVCFCLAFLPSIAALSLLLAAASTLAAVTFPVTCMAWFVVTLLVRHRESIQPSSHDIK